MNLDPLSPSSRPPPRNPMWTESASGVGLPGLVGLMDLSMRDLCLKYVAWILKGKM